MDLQILHWIINKVLLWSIKIQKGGTHLERLSCNEKRIKSVVNNCHTFAYIKISCFVLFHLARRMCFLEFWDLLDLFGFCFCFHWRPASFNAAPKQENSPEHCSNTSPGRDDIKKYRVLLMIAWWIYIIWKNIFSDIVILFHPWRKVNLLDLMCWNNTF